MNDCEHCPDGHAHPTSRPWGAFVASERDGDGQPTHLRVQPTAGQHVAESDAEWVHQRLNDDTPDQIAARVIHQLADRWQWSAWADAPRHAGPLRERLATAQYVTDWLRSQAPRP